MRLLNVDNLEFCEFSNHDRPKYAIASHRWVHGFEATFDDFCKRRNTDGIGYKKVEAFASYVKTNFSWIEWLWVDTCCINKESAAELSESINLMFDWYHDAELCIARLADVETVEDKNSFQKSVWFTRGWTLQELLAPRTVVFVTRSWQVIGCKGTLLHDEEDVDMGPRLEGEIANITALPENVLHDFKQSVSLSVEERLKWMEKRTTTREEDESYALYGVFGVSPGANYGEKRKGARDRLLAALRLQEDLAVQRAELFRKISEWLNPPDPWTNHDSARQRHEPGTGSWLLKSRQYQAWKSGVAGHLCLFGKAGCGKTILCSTAIDDVQKYCRGMPNVGHAVFYFSFADKKKQSFESLVCSLIVQLGSREPSLTMLIRAYQDHARIRPGIEELVTILICATSSYDTVFLTIDALDECPPEEGTRIDMLHRLTALAQRAKNLRLFVTSRQEQDVRDAITLFNAVSISTVDDTVNADIRKYVSSQISIDRKLSRLPSTVSDVIEDTLSRKSNGMFRWAYCQVQELKALKSTKPKAIISALESLPESLDETYERMLRKIGHRDRDDALTLLRWTAYAERPLSLAELAEATIVSFNNNLAEDLVDTENRGHWMEPLDILGGLVTVQDVSRSPGEEASTEHRAVPGYHKPKPLTGEGGLGQHASQNKTTPGSTGHLDSCQSSRAQCPYDDDSMLYVDRYVDRTAEVRLSHFSVKEYLESQRILHDSLSDFHLDPMTHHRFLAQSCLVYLMAYSAKLTELSRVRAKSAFPLLAYAAKSWSYHAMRQANGSFEREIALLNNAKNTRAWVKVHNPEHAWRLPSRNRPNHYNGTGLYYASYLGLESLVAELISKGSDVNACGGAYNTALCAATFSGHEKIVKMLIDANADPTISGPDESALTLAEEGPHNERIAQILEEACATWINPNPNRTFDSLVPTTLNVGDWFDFFGIPKNRSISGPEDSAHMLATRAGHERVARVLGEAGATRNDPNPDADEGSDSMVPKSPNLDDWFFEFFDIPRDTILDDQNASQLGK